ncbi:MAG: sigma-54 dependent transcriptional regulator [Thermodesulfobacteriota bacterium]
MAPSILVVDDEPNALFTLSQMLTDDGYRVISASGAKEALGKIKKNMIDLVVTDIKMPDMSGMDLLSAIRQVNEDIPVILLTAYGSISMAVEALRQGAYYFFEKPIFSHEDKFLAIIRQALKTQRLEKELVDLRQEVIEKYSFPNIIGDHPKMLRVYEFISRICNSDKTVLIQGESGTGKDLIAKSIHFNSPRNKKPLISVNCGALTETLLSSELFGHSRGAFTGAVKDTMGKFQAADGGTLILEEMGEVPLHSQKVFLKVLEEKKLEPVGSHQTKKVDVRIIVTTHRNLREEVEKGNFREDLFYRLSILSLTIPPLRERLSDLPLLVDFFLKKFQEGPIPFRIEPAVIDYLATLYWPGNIRELANVIQHMITFCRGNTLTMEDLPPSLISGTREEKEPARGEIDLPALVSDLEKRWIVRKLAECGGNKENTRKMLGMTRRMLLDRIKKYEIKVALRK